MKHDKKNQRPDSTTVRVFPRTKRRIKIFAARHGMPAARYLDDLVPALSDHEAQAYSKAKATKARK